jgi:hypothetical protein
MDALRSQLEERLADAERRLDKSVKVLLNAKEDAVTAKHDVEVYRATLETITRDNGTPYIAKPVITAADSLFASNGYKPAVVSRSPSSSRSEMVRRIIMEQPGLRTREVYDLLVAQNLPKPPTIEEVHRVTSRLIMREEANRDDDGGLHYIGKPKKR